MQDALNIAIIGGGAGGLVAAISAGEEARKLDVPVDIHIYEATDKIGRPILASGNGRCNFSNASIDANLYHNGGFVGECLGELDALMNADDAGSPFPNGVVAWLTRHGLMYMEEGEGRLYPRANKSSSVLDVLKMALENVSVNVHLDAKLACVERASKPTSHLTMRMADGAFERADKVVLACGGKVHGDVLPDGILDFSKTRPVLCALEFDKAGKKVSKSIKDVRVKCELSLIRNGETIANEMGEAMFREYGISGICAFNLSRFANTGDVLRVDFFPDVQNSALKASLEERANTLQRTYGHPLSVEELLCGMLLPGVAFAIADRAGVAFEKPIDNAAIAKLAHVLRAFDFTIAGPANIEHAQVQRGGFNVEGVSSKTMEVRNMPGLYVVGEALDVDGPCGGYNLTWAFATGILAGLAAVQSAQSS